MIKSQEHPIENREKALKKLEPLMACIQTVRTDTEGKEKSETVISLNSGSNPPNLNKDNSNPYA